MSGSAYLYFEFAGAANNRFPPSCRIIALLQLIIPAPTGTSPHLEYMSAFIRHAAAERYPETCFRVSAYEKLGSNFDSG